MCGHAPALWLLYGERMPAGLARKNAVAIGLTLAGATAAALSGRGRSAVWRAGLVWLAGHVAWGAYLASRLPSGQDPRQALQLVPEPSAKSVSDR